MSDLTQKAILYRMVILYILLFSINALATTIVASFLNVEWTELSTTSKFLVIVVILQNWTGVLLAFFNKSLQRVEQGQFPIQPDDEPKPTIQKP